MRSRRFGTRGHTPNPPPDWSGKYSTFSHYGAEVIKVEPPNVGDPLRVWRERDIDGVSPWWRSIARNKKSVTIDMRKEEGRR